MKRLSCLSVLVLCVSVLLVSHAFANESKRIADRIAPLLNENIALVGHVDLDKIRPQAIAEQVRSLADRWVDGLTADQAVESGISERAVSKKIFAEEIAARTSFCSEHLEAFRKNKVRDVYFLTYTTLLPQFPVVFAFPLEDGADPKAIEQLVRSLPGNKEPSLFAVKVVRRFLLVIPDPGRREVGPFAWQQIELKATPRPELLNVLKKVEGSALQWVLIPPNYMRRVLKERTETFPVPFENLSIPFLAEHLRWAVFAFDADRMSCELTLQMRHAQAATDLRTDLEKTVDSWMNYAREQVEMKLLLTLLESDGKDAPTILKNMLPQAEKNTLVWKVDRAFFESRLDLLGNIPETIRIMVIASVAKEQCDAHLKEIVLAMHNHYDTYFKLPSLYTTDRDGKPLHSWRVALLPFLGEIKIFKKIRHDEPWDSEYNRQFHNQCPAVYQCPAATARDPKIKEQGLTTYSVITGKQAWPEGNKKYEFGMITDGTSNTWAVVERKRPVCWMDPTVELTQEEAMKGINRAENGIATPHPSGRYYGTNVGFFDGSVRFFTENLSLDSARRHITRNGGEIYEIKYDEEAESQDSQ